MDPVRRPSPFLEQIRAAIRVRHYSIRTEESYLFWVRRFILFHGKRHPRELGESQVGEFLTHLAVDRKVSGNFSIRRGGEVDRRCVSVAQ